MQQKKKTQADTHVSHTLDFSLDGCHLRSDDHVIVREVQTQQVIVDQPQRHVTSELGGFHGQLRHLAVRKLVQFDLTVQAGAHVRVQLEGKKRKRQLISRWGRRPGAPTCVMPPLTLSEVNLKETEGMPEKARNGYAALSTFRSVKLGTARKALWTTVVLNVRTTGEETH